MPEKSEKQRKFMGSELARKRAGKKTKTDMSAKQLKDFARKKKQMEELKKKIGEKDFKFNQFDVEVCGIRYSYGLFEAWGFGGMEIGTLFRLVSREDTVIAIETLIDEKKK